MNTVSNTASLDTATAPAKKVPSMPLKSLLHGTPYRDLNTKELGRNLLCLMCASPSLIANQKGQTFCGVECMEMTMGLWVDAQAAERAAKKLSANVDGETIVAYIDGGKCGAIELSAAKRDKVFTPNVHILSLWKDGKNIAGPNASLDTPDTDPGLVNTDFTTAAEGIDPDFADDTNIDTDTTNEEIPTMNTAPTVTLETLANEVTPILPAKKRKSKKDVVATTEPFVTNDAPASTTPVVEAPAAKSYLADPTQVVDLETGEPVAEKDITPAVDAKTEAKKAKTEAAPAVPKYTIVVRHAGKAPELLGTPVASDKEAYKNLVAQAEALRAAGHTLIGSWDTGYVILDADLLKVGELHIGNVDTHNPTLIFPPGRPTSALHPERLYKSARNKAQTALNAAFAAFATTPNDLTEEALVSAMAGFKKVAQVGQDAFRFNLGDRRGETPVAPIVVPEGASVTIDAATGSIDVTPAPAA